MPKYLFQANYTVEGAKGIHKDGGTARRAAVQKAVAELGWRLEAFYFAFGGTDVYTIVELPDNTTAAAMAMAVAESGKASAHTTVLLTPEEIDAAAKKNVAYRGPGG